MTTPELTIKAKRSKPGAPRLARCHEFLDNLMSEGYFEDEDNAVLLDAMETLSALIVKTVSDDETDAEIALRKIACCLGVGGFNAPTVDADLYCQKILDAIVEIQPAKAGETACLKEKK